MKKMIITSLIIVIINLFYPHNNTNKVNTYLNIKDSYNQQNIIEKEKPIGKLIIKKINLENNLYDINSDNNNIEKNVTILYERLDNNIKNNIIILAAHSGNGKIAFFNNIDKLKLNDEVILKYKNIEYNYNVSYIYETDKNGHIDITNNNQSKLILTTCSKNKGKQLIIECTKKES